MEHWNSLSTLHGLFTIRKPPCCILLVCKVHDLAAQSPATSAVRVVNTTQSLTWSLHLQAKQFDPDFGMDGDDEDGWEDALRHLDACGPGVHLQIGRTSSDRREGSLKSTSSGGLGVLFDDSLRDKVNFESQMLLDHSLSDSSNNIIKLFAWMLST